MTKTWDTRAFQDGILRSIEGKERYRREHISRIARKQGNGSGPMRDSLTGEIKALEALLGGAMYPTAASMLAKIDGLLAQSAPTIGSVEFADSYQQGWLGELRQIRTAVSQYDD